MWTLTKALFARDSYVWISSRILNNLRQINFLRNTCYFRALKESLMSSSCNYYQIAMAVGKKKKKFKGV